MPSIDLEAIESLLFPHSQVREIQDELIRKIDACIKAKRNLIVHAPTGLGKTAAALSPALTYTIKNPDPSLTIFFLTSRHTQHKIVTDTLRKINEKFSLNINGTSIIGKKHLCLQPNAAKMHGKEFGEFCRLLVDDGKCNYYLNSKSKNTDSPSAISAATSIKSSGMNVANTESIIAESSRLEICPYEISMLLARGSKVIVADYHYIFNPSIRKNFFKRLNKELSSCIIIVDEAHNLPSRVKDLSSEYLSNIALKRAIAEAKRYHHEDLAQQLEELLAVLEKYAKGLSDNESMPSPKIEVTLNSFKSAGDVAVKKFGDPTNEKHVDKHDFMDKVNKIKNYEEFISELAFLADSIREEQSMSYLGSLTGFLQGWQGTDEGFTRILSVKKLRDKSDMITLSYRCLDPGIITAPVIAESHSTVLMSGTLTPTSMYKELLGIEADELTLRSPFPIQNRMNIIIPKTSTKYEVRNQEQYKSIAGVIADVIKNVPGCIAIYFPSYYLMEQISRFLSTAVSQTIFTERAELNKAEKLEFLDSFTKYVDRGAVLLAVIGGSFAEGIDLPGLLKMVIIVGLPLQKPDLETNSLIEYYDKKFKKGWDYGYLFPAFTKTIQAAGRCIRSEKDKGIIVFLDERYAWNNYMRCFPPHWNMRVTLLYEQVIKDFYNSKSIANIDKNTNI